MKIRSAFSIFLPSIILLLTSYFLDKKYLSSSPIYLMPLFFGVVLGFFNYKFYKHKIYFNQAIQVVLISVIISFLCFVFAAFSYPLLANVIDFLFEKFSIKLGKESIARLSLFFAVDLVAPLSVLLTFKGVFAYPKGIITKILIAGTLIVFALLGYLSFFINNESSLLWMPLMAFSIQLILYQKELKALFKPNNR
ncbi:hypothetical protein V1387_02215 [Allomuricauda taeanensis]|uniref:hypothetical protein n=1 Tax=Flagellimonas taeanensis TaxID=1005926 RepID=UPI002E7B7630|nr:hypothetical protein [Allomuricauda taeanensis]MEE1961484.1 hypothetical protein [Allomuricauda taeanensis]